MSSLETTNASHDIKCCVAGNRKPVQRSEGGATAALGKGGAQAGPLPGVRRRHVDSTSVLLHARRSLAGLYLVLYR